MNGTPITGGTYNLQTAYSSGAASVLCVAVPSGTWDVTAVSSNTLINVKRSVVVGGATMNLSLGTLLSGNADGNGLINILDFGILAGAYSKSTGALGFDTRADFDNDGIVDITDFGIFAGNYQKASPLLVP